VLGSIVPALLFKDYRVYIFLWVPSIFFFMLLLSLVVKYYIPPLIVPYKEEKTKTITLDLSSHN